MPAQFINQNTIASMLNPQVNNLGSLIGAPLAQGLARSDQYARQDQLLADKQGREDQLLQQETELRADTSEALSLLQQPLELRRQALMGRRQVAIDENDPDEVAEIDKFLNLDDVSQTDSLKQAVLRGAHTLPSGVLQSAGLGGASERFHTPFEAIDPETGKPALFQSSSTGGLQRVNATPLDKAALAGRVAGSKVTATAKAKESTADIVAGVEGKISGAKEKEKLKQQLNFRPQIQKSLDRAKNASSDEEKLAAKKANLPNIIKMAESLRNLAPTVTHTMGGKIVDAMIKESGFGATKGSTARAKYQAIIDNKVLPLLKETFGSAFTEAEGGRLAATLGDVDASPEEKMAQLDAFLEAQSDEIGSLERKLAPEDAPQPANVGRFQIKVKN